MNKVQLTLLVLRLRDHIERWVDEGAFTDEAYRAEANRLVEEVPSFD